MIELKWATVICSTMALLVYQMVYQIVFRHLPLCPIISHYIPFYAIISHFMPFYPIMSHYIPFYAILSHFMPLYPILCHSIPFYAILSHYVPLYPILCHSIPLYPKICAILSYCISRVSMVKTSGRNPPRDAGSCWWATSETVWGC